MGFDAGRLHLLRIPDGFCCITPPRFPSSASNTLHSSDSPTVPALIATQSAFHANECEPRWASKAPLTSRDVKHGQRTHKKCSSFVCLFVFLAESRSLPPCCEDGTLQQ